MKEQFIQKDFKKSSLQLIKQANEIIEDYQRQGFTLTLRQLYYQFVRRTWLANNQNNYKRLGKVINDARLRGLVDWNAIEDRTRNVVRPSVWDDPESIVDAVARQYKEDLWLGQKYRPEVWVEKEALTGVIQPVCDRWRLPFFACRGYTSQSEQYESGKRFERVRRAGQIPIVLHLGDHDPSGLDMTRDNADRLEMFARHEVQVVRLALNMDQIEQYDPPPNPAKDTDARFTNYEAEYGESSWELDALDPTVIDALIEAKIDELIDRPLWDEKADAERINRESLANASEAWDRVKLFLTHKDGEFNMLHVAEVMGMEGDTEATTTLDEVLTELVAYGD